MVPSFSLWWRLLSLCIFNALSYWPAKMTHNRTVYLFFLENENSEHFAPQIFWSVHNKTLHVNLEVLGKYLNSEWFWLYIILGNTFAIIHSLIHCWNVYCINVNRVLFICIRVCLLPVFFCECWNLIIQHFLCQFKYCSKRDFVYTTKSKYITLKLLVNRGIQTSDTIYLKLGCPKLNFCLNSPSKY